LLLPSHLTNVCLNNINPLSVTVSFEFSLPDIDELALLVGDRLLAAYHRQYAFQTGQQKEQKNYKITFEDPIETSLALHKKHKTKSWIIYELKKKEDDPTSF